MDRFWDKVDKNGPIPEHCPEIGQCWVWIAAPNAKGYGNFWLHGRYWLAHRAACFLTGNPLPDDKNGCHACDNRLCVRPSHIFPGTQQENMDDAKAKGRVHRGENVHTSKLSEDDVRQIRERYVPFVCTQQMLADEFGVDRSMIGYITRGKNWSHA